MNDQRSVTDQLIDVMKWAERNGKYDAADWIKKRLWPDQYGVDAFHRMSNNT